MGVKLYYTTVTASRTVSRAATFYYARQHVCGFSCAASSEQRIVQQTHPAL